MEERLRTTAWLALVLVAACGGRAAPPTPEESQNRPPPDLTGSSVMVLPAQPAAGSSALREPVPGLDREIAYWLAERAPRVRWVFPDQIQRALARSPSIEVDIYALNVSIFHRAQVENIGDPLFGQLHAVATLVGARYALIPVAAGYVANDAAADSGRVEMHVALIDTRGGRVLWFGAAAGQPGPENGAGVVASAAGALADLLAR